MHDDRVIIPFPSDTIRLNGVLQDTLSAIHCATSNLTYRDYRSIRSTFLFASEAVFIEAVKSLSTKGEIAIDTKVASTFAEKNLCNMTDEIALATVLIMCAEKAISIHSELGIGSMLMSSAEKNVKDLNSDFSISGVADFVLKKVLVACSEIGFENAEMEMQTEKALESSETISEISSAANIVCEKYGGTIIDTVEFSSIVKFSLAKYRLLKDIDTLSLSGIDNWTMSVFDMISG